MLILAKGVKIEQFAGAQMGIMFDIDKTIGGILFFVVDEAYLGQYKLGGHYDFWCTNIEDTLFFAVKLGANPWASAPYSPFMSKEYNPEYYSKGTGMSLTVALVNNTNGIVVDVDFMVLGNLFSNTLTSLNKGILKKGFNPVRHQMIINAVYQKYMTDEELVCQHGARYSID